MNNINVRGVNNNRIGDYIHSVTYTKIPTPFEQFGSPHINFTKQFHYLSKIEEDYTSYTDLSDGGISINEFGGLNYYEIYKNYINKRQYCNVWNY